MRVPLDGHVARFSGAGRLMLFHVVERGFDYFSAAACRRLFAMVHGRFEQRVGHLFGSVIAGSFQDELPNMPTWSPDFGERFIAEAGYDPLPHLGRAVGGPGRGWRAVPRRLPPRARRAGGALVLPAAARVARAPRPAVRGRSADRRARGRADRLERDLRRLRPHSPVVQRAGLRPPRRRQAALVARPPLRAAAGLDRVLPHLGLGRDAGGDLRLAAAVDRRGGDPLQPARDLLLDARGLVGVGAARHRLAPAVLAPLRAVRPRGRPAVLGAELGRACLRGRRAVPGRDRARRAPPRRSGRGRAARGGALSRPRRPHALVRSPARRAEPARPRLRRPRRRQRRRGGRARRPAADRAGGVRGDRAPRLRRARGAHGRAPDRVRRRRRDADRGRAAACARCGHERWRRGGRRAGGAIRIGRRASAWPSPTRSARRWRPCRAACRLRSRRCCGPTATPGSCSSPPCSRVRPSSTGSPRASCIRGRSDLSYRFDPAGHADAMDVVLAGVEGEVEVWEPFSGARRRAECEPVEGGVRVRLDFADGPCALLVWGMGGAARDPCRRGAGAGDGARRRVGGRGRGDARGRLGGPGGAGGRDRRDLGTRGRGSTRRSGRARGGRGRRPTTRSRAGCRRRRVERRRVVAVARHPQGPHPRRLPRPERPRAGGVPRLRPGRRRAGRAPPRVVDSRATCGDAAGGRRRRGEARVARRPAGRAGRHRLPRDRRSRAARAARGRPRPAPRARRRTSPRCGRTSRSSPTSRATRDPSGCGLPGRSRRARSSRSRRASRYRPTR